MGALVFELNLPFKNYDREWFELGKKENELTFSPF